MPRYEYTAIAPTGRKTKGSIAAESPYAARKQLRARSIHPTSVVESNSERQLNLKDVFSGLSRPKKSQVIEVAKQLATLLNSGIKLTEALSVMTLQVSDPKLKHALSDIRDRVVTGESFTDALKDYDNYFDVIFVSMVKVGEVTGTMGDSLATIANFMEKRQRVESKVITAMVYPIVVTIFMFGAILILTTKVIPTIGEQIKSAGMELPWLTKQLMNVGYVLTSPWLILIIFGFLVITSMLRKFFKTERGAYLRDRFLLGLPVFGPLFKQRVVARFASTLSTLLRSGLPMAESLRVVSETTGNVLMKQALRNARERILSGADIATPLRDSGVIDPAIAHMVAVGEKSGELETMLKNISDDLEASTDVVIERLGAAFEPLIIIVMAAIIGIIAYATLVPIIQFSTSQL